MLGAELLEAHPVVPVAERHALSVGIFTHLEKLHFGLYADPEAFPQVSQLPGALDVSLGELLLRPREMQATRGRSPDRPLVASG
jgi:diacylglycerol O-acyltransferase